MNAYFAEFIGTAILVTFGNGVVPNAARSHQGEHAGWIVITAGWSLAVFIGAFCAAPSSGANLNPTVTVAKAAVGKLEAAQGRRLPRGADARRYRWRASGRSGG